jgi:hypothetical protein
MCDKSLRLVGIDPEKRWSKEKRSLNFKEHYGSTPLSLAHVWYDITVFDFDASLKLKDFEKEQRGFMMFMVANFYVWTYPRNAGLIAAHFDIGKYYCRGRPLWIWIERVAALRAKKIVWIRELDDPNAECFVVTIDGTDFKTWEKKHPTLNMDTGQYTKKHAHGGLKYQVVISMYHQRVVHIYGPCRGGLGDKTMLTDSGVLGLIKKGKLAIVDRGYLNYANKDKLSWPNAQDHPAVNNIKSRGRLRQESFNGRCSYFKILNDEFRNGTKKHGAAFLMVAVLVQYSMENGNPLFLV